MEEDQKGDRLEAEGHREPQVAISHHESNLGWGQPGDITTNDDDSSDHGAGEAAKAEMAIAPEANDTPSGSAMTQSSDPLPAKG